jgi:Ca-activated chloride channel family protein
MPDSHFDHGFDAELRGVPLPEGLLKRLRKAALVDDEGLDAAVRYVQVPATLLDSLRVVPVADEALDESLAAVWVPPDLTDRLFRVVLETDDGMDEVLRDVPIPAGAVRPFELPKRRLALDRVTFRRAVQWATALSLVLLVGLFYFGAMGTFLMSAYRMEKGIRPALESGISLRAAEESYEPPIEFEAIAAIVSLEEEQVPVPPTPRLELAEQPRPSGGVLAEVEELLDPDRRDNGLLDVTRYLWPDVVYTSHDWESDKTILLDKVPPLVRRGVELPLAPGVEAAIQFRMRYGVHPFVVPAAHPKWHVSEVPLGADRASYELTRRCLKDGELPPPQAVRTEDFLAAVHYDLPEPEAGKDLSLFTAGGPSPFGDPRTSLSLLTIGVHARNARGGRHLPTHLVVAVDVSATMRLGGRLEMIRRAMAELFGQLGRDDRISIVDFSQEANVLLEDGDRNARERVLAALEQLEPSSRINVGRGLGEAYAVAQRGTALGDPGAARIVLISDGLMGLPGGITDPIEQRLADAAEREIHLDVIDLGEGKEGDPLLARFARAGGGQVFRAANADQIRWTLLNVVTGEDQRVAENVRLKVTFNPDAVVAYRLLGHEPETSTDRMPAPLEVSFYTGQSAVALYEIQWKNNGHQNIARVELTWNELGQSGSFGQQSIARTVQRRHFAATLAESAPAVQAAALAAQAAEVLRRSPFAWSARGVRRMAAVLELAHNVDTRLYHQPSFEEFLSVVEKADEARPYRRGARN